MYPWEEEHDLAAGKAVATPATTSSPTLFPWEIEYDNNLKASEGNAPSKAVQAKLHPWEIEYDNAQPTPALPTLAEEEPPQPDFNQQILDVEKYHNELPYRMAGEDLGRATSGWWENKASDAANFFGLSDPSESYDAKSKELFIRLNELATGEVYRYSENPEGRAEELRKERQAMMTAGINDPVEWLSSQDQSKEFQDLLFHAGPNASRTGVPMADAGFSVRPPSGPGTPEYKEWEIDRAVWKQKQKGKQRTEAERQQNYKAWYDQAMDSRQHKQGWDEYTLDRTPFVGGAINAIEFSQLQDSIRSIQNGTADAWDFDLVVGVNARWEAQEKRGNLAKVGGLVASLPGFAIEFALTGPGGAAAKTVAKKAVKKIIQKYAKRQVTKAIGKAVANVAGVGAEVGMRTLQQPQRILGETYRNQLPNLDREALLSGDAARAVDAINDGKFLDLGTALAKGTGNAAIETLTEMSGAAIGQVLGKLGKYTGATKLKEALLKKFGFGAGESGAVSKALEAGGFNGLLEEVGEERLGDVLRGLTGVSDDYGTVGDILSGDRERVTRGLEQMMIESAAFAVPGGIRTASELSRRDGNSEVDPVSKFIEKPTRSNARKLGLPGNVTKTKKQRESLAAKLKEINQVEAEVESSQDIESFPEDGESTSNESFDAMPNVADIPGSAPKGRYGPLESEQAYRTVETSGDAKVDVSKPITPRQVIDSIEAVGQAFGADVPIRGNLLGRAKKALGYYMPNFANIRLLARFDAATAAHEIGHAALRGMKIDNPDLMKAAAGNQAHDEMVSLGKDLYGERKPAGGYYNEGLAEFFRYYIARSPEAAQEKAPKFYAAFQDLVAQHPDGLAAMQHAQQQVKLWGDQGAIARMDAQMVDPSSRKHKRSEAVRRLKKSKPIVRHIEEFEPLREYTRAYEAGSGQEIEKTEFDPYTKAKERRGRGNAHLDRMIKTEMVDINGNHAGESLYDALAPIEKKDFQDFQRFLYARRALALYESQVGARDPGIARADALYAYEKFRSPKFEKAADNLHQWWKGVLDYVSEASPEIAKNVERTREQNTKEFGVSHGYYVPLHRVLEGQVRGTKQGGGDKQLDGKLSKALRGSPLPIKEVLPQLVGKASSLIQAAHRRAVADTVFNLYDRFKKDPRNQKLGNYLEPIPEAVVPVDIPLGQVISKFRKVMATLGISETQVFGVGGLDAVVDSPAEFTDVIDYALATFYKKSGKAAGGKNESPILTRVENGKMTFYRADPNLYDALLPAPPAFVQMLRNTPILSQAHAAIVKTNRVARTGMVGLRAGFSLVTSPIREAQGLALHSAETNPLTLAHDYINGFIEASTYALSGGNVEMEWMKTLHRLGVQMASPLAEDAMNTRQAAKEAVQTKTQRVLDVRNWFSFVSDVFQSLDAAPRIAEMKRVARKHNWTPDMPITEEIAREMGLQAKEITADFGAGSGQSRAMNEIFMFYNIAIQGPRATYRAFKEHPVRFMAGVMTLLALTLKNWWDNKDEEWWKERNRREDFSYIRVKFGDEVVRIPINQEASQIPQAIMVMLDAAYNRDPEGATEYFGALVDLLRPSLPVLAEYTRESLANKRTYNNAPIVPQHLLRASPEDQFGTYTTETTKVVGNVLGWSPAKIEHAVRSFGGGLGGDLLGASDSLFFGSKEGTGEWAELPLVGRLFQRGGLYGTRPASLNKVFEAYAEAEKRQFSTRTPETEEERQLRLQLLDGKKAVTAMLNLRSLVKTNQDKRRLTKEAVELAKEVVKDYRSQNLRRGDWQKRRKAEQRRRDG